METHPKNLLVIGTGHSLKKTFFQKIHELGIHIILVDKPDSWGFPYADDFIICDTSNYQSTLDSIESFKKDHPDLTFDGIITFWEGDVILTSKIVDHFNFIGIPQNIVEKVRNKFEFRNFCQQNAIRVPQHILVSSSADLQKAVNDFSFPLVIKPVYGANSSYVVKVENEKELKDTYQYLQNNISVEVDPILQNGLQLMVEEYIAGEEVDIDMLVQNGIIKFMPITDNLITHEPFFVEAGEICPSQLPQSKQEELKIMAEKIIKALQIKNGVFHLEAKSTNKGAVPIELNLRMGGGDVYLYMKKVWGVDFIDYATKIALGINFEKMPNPTPLRYMVSETFIINAPGIITELYFDDELKHKEYVEKIYFAKKVGDRVSTPPENYDTLGWITVSGNSYEEAKKNLEEAKKFVHSKIQPIEK